MAKLTVLSFGAGQDSTAILYKYIYDADFRVKYAPEDFLVIMSDTGDEHASTYKHVKEIRELCKEHGGRIVAFYMTMGPYDMTIIVEAPDDATIARLALMGGKQGDTRTLTLKAFTEDEYRKIVGSLG